MTEREIELLIKERIVELEEYNGWANYETWCVVKWLVQYDCFKMLQDWCRVKKLDEFELAEKVKQFVISANPLKSQGSVYRCLIDSALGRVNWIELVWHFKSGIDGEQGGR